MEQVEVQLTRKIADGYIIPLGPANLVAVMTDIGMVGCGAFDVAALDSFSYPAAKVRPAIGPSIVDSKPISFGTRYSDRYDRPAGAGTSLTLFL
jgi:hypothetical protein